MLPSSSTQRGVLIYVHPWGCTVHHLSCTVQPIKQKGMGQVFTFARVGVVKCRASENVALVQNAEEPPLQLAPLT